LKANPNSLAISDYSPFITVFMLVVIVKNGRKQTTLMNCKKVVVKATSFNPSKRKDFRFKIKAKSNRPKENQARLW
jgi:hypothetical protein